MWTSFPLESAHGMCRGHTAIPQVGVVDQRCEEIGLDGGEAAAGVVGEEGAQQRPQSWSTVWRWAIAAMAGEQSRRVIETVVGYRIR